MQFTPRVQVLSSDGSYVFSAHAKLAQRMILEGQAFPAGKGHKARAIILHSTATDDYKQRHRHGNPHKYTYLESLRSPYPCSCGMDPDCPACAGSGEALQVDGHCQALKSGIARPRNWPIFRAALVDCLPAAAQAQIRELFS